MTTRDEWLALAKRCEEARGPDREIDQHLAALAGWRRVEHNNVKHKAATWFPPGSNLAKRINLTASLDAITALIDQQCTPNWWVDRNCGGAYAGVHVIDKDEAICTDAWTAPLALCAAFCRAMAEKVKG